MSKNWLKTAALGAALVLMLAACAKNEGKEGAPSGAEKAKSASTVLADVNGKEITADDFQEEASTLMPNTQKALSDEKNKEKFLENLVEKQLIVQEASKKGYDKDPEVVKRIERVKANLLLGLFVKKEVLDKANVSDQDAQAYFQAHKQELGSVRISHILVATQKDADDVLARLKAGGDFAKLAKQYSLDSKTKDSGGDLGYVKWSQFGSSSLKDAAFKLKPGEVSGIVQSQFGYHIMKVTDKKPAADGEYEAMKDSVKGHVLEQKKEELFDSLVKGLKEKAKINEHKEALKDLVVAPRQQGGGIPPVQ